MTVRTMSRRERKPAATGRRPIVYPTSDGKPMAETDYHRDEMMRCISTLDRYFADRPDVYVSGNLFLYYEEGNPRAAVSPDTLVVFGVPKGRRDTFKVWEEGGHLPSAVFEITSRKTRREDLYHKHDLYQRLGVPEYFLYDVLADYLRPKVRGYRLVGAGYQAIEPEADGSLLSTTLGVRLRLVDGWLRFFDAASGAELFSKEEQGERDAQRADDAEERAAAAEERATVVTAQADQLAARAEAETAARRQLEEEIARLHAQLRPDESA